MVLETVYLGGAKGELSNLPQHSKASVHQQHVQVLPWSCYPVGFADQGEGFYHLGSSQMI